MLLSVLALKVTVHSHMFSLYSCYRTNYDTLLCKLHENVIRSQVIDSFLLQKNAKIALRVKVHRNLITTRV